MFTLAINTGLGVLGLYDRISKGGHKSYTNEIWMVHDYVDNTGVELGEWLKR